MFLRKSKEKELKMICEVMKNRKRSFLIGTAHFFPYSFRTSLSPYIKNAAIVLFEGPLDKDSMVKVVNAGFEKEGGVTILEQLDRQTIDELTGVLALPGKDRIPYFFFNAHTSGAGNPLYSMIEGMKPWMAFFTIWTKFLKKKGWRYSVDLEAYNIAQEMGKDSVFLETIEEQIQVLESLSLEKIIDFLKRVDRWSAYAQDYVKCYLDGDLEKLKSTMSGFPTRRFSVIDGRDRILYERMLPYLEKGDAVAFVGAPHIRGISDMLRADEYQTIRQ